MGITNLNTIITEHAPNARIKIPMKNFASCKIAIDGNGWMYTYMAAARKKVINETNLAAYDPCENAIRKEWFGFLINFVIDWLDMGITPVFVFDGEHPKEKQTTKDKRKEKRVNLREQLNKVRLEIDSYKTGSILDRPPADIINKYARDLINYNNISSEDFSLFKSIVRSIGIPTLQAIGDGERLCSMLAIDGYVDAVYSADTDNLAHGCPLVIQSKQKPGIDVNHDIGGNVVRMFECIRFDKVLEDLNLTHAEFVDLCILCGCDYNTHIYRCGPVKSLDYIRKYKSIDNIPSDIDISCLNHEVCRDLFRYIKSEELSTDELKLDINLDCLNSLHTYFDTIQANSRLYAYMTMLTNFCTDIKGNLDYLELKQSTHYDPSLLPKGTRCVPPKNIVLNILPSNCNYPVQVTPQYPITPIKLNIISQPN